MGFEWSAVPKVTIDSVEQYHAILLSNCHSNQWLGAMHIKAESGYV